MAKVRKKQVLGRGLSAILSDNAGDIQSANDKNADKIIGNIIEVPLDRIEVNPYQPRTQFDEESLNELAASIRELGIIQPVTLRKTKDDKFQLVSGERRFRASKIAGLKQIPAYIRLADDDEMLEMALVENIQRKDLDPIEIAISYQRLIDELGLTQENLSKRVGKKRSTVTNYIRLLKLNPIIQTGIRDGFISMGHGRALINIADDKQQLDIYKKIIEQGLSVRQTEQLVKNLASGKPKKSHSVKRETTETADDLSRFFGNKVQVKMDDSGKGYIRIPFASEEDYLRIKKILGL